MQSVGGRFQVLARALATPGYAPLFAMMPAKDYIKANTAVGRVGVPRDVGGVIAFLCSPQTSFVSGAVLSIDGGYHL